MDKFRGCLLGLTVGDALGAQVDRLRHDRRRPEQRGEQMAGGAVNEPLPGRVTANTEQMVRVLDSYLENSTFDAHDVAERLLQWYRSGPHEIDHLTREACENLLYGYNFERAGRDAWENAAPGSRYGDQSLARCIPAGLIHYHDNIHLIGESRVICGITHADERCKLGCALLNLAIAHLLMVGTDGLIDELLDFIEPRNTVLGYALKSIPVVRREELVSTGEITNTLMCAIWTVLYCDDLVEGMLLLTRMGGHAATTCAVGGALLGTRFGAGAVPPRWIENMSQRFVVDRGAQRLYQLSQEG